MELLTRGIHNYHDFALAPPCTPIFKVNLEWPFSDLENEISVCVRNWELKTLILGCWAKKQLLTEKKVQNLGSTAESCRKPKTNNQQLLRNKLTLELKYEVNLRFETQIWKPENEKPGNEKLNSRFTLKGPFTAERSQTDQSPLLINNQDFALFKCPTWVSNFNRI